MVVFFDYLRLSSCAFEVILCEDHLFKGNSMRIPLMSSDVLMGM